MFLGRQRVRETVYAVGWGDVYRLVRDIEREWGVRVALRSDLQVGRGGPEGLLITAYLPAEIHRAELCDPPEVSVLWWEGRRDGMATLVYQALWDWQAAVVQTLSTSARPAL